MFESYTATPEDFLAIEDALRAVWNPKLDFIFHNKKPIRSTIVISYDSQFIYFWIQKKLSGIARRPCSVKNYYAHKIPHQRTFSEELHHGWCAGVIPEIDELLPDGIKKQSTFSIPRISGGLLTPFVALQKTLPKKAQSLYYPRVVPGVHEFGHVYWDSYKLRWPLNKQENLRYLNTAKTLYTNKSDAYDMRLRIPTPYGISEVYAHCSEHYASQLFWPLHKYNVDLFAKDYLKDLLAIEKQKDVEREDSVLEPTRYPYHDLAFVFDKLLLTYYPKTWPTILLTRPELRRDLPPRSSLPL